MKYSEIDNLRTQIDSLVEEQIEAGASLSDSDFVLKMREYENLCSDLTAF